MKIRKSKNIQVIYVMWLREIKRLLRSKARVISSLAMPFFFLFSMSFGFRSGFSATGAPDGIGYLDFLVPGILGMTMLFTSMFTGLSVLWDKEFGFLKEIMVAPVKRILLVLGRIIGGITTSLIQASFIFIISLFLGFRVDNIFSILLAFIFMLLIGIGFIGFGIAIASKMDDIHGFPLVMQLIIFPTFLLSGALFPVSNFPAWLRPVIYVNPLAYGIDGLRSSLIGFSQFPVFLDLIVILCYALFTVSLASWFFEKTEV